VLYQSQQHLRLRPDEIDDANVAATFKEQIERLRSKLKQIAGEAELRAFDEQQATQIHSAGNDEAGGGSVRPGCLTDQQLAHELLGRVRRA
jgi:hypothetical protein